MTIHDTLTAFTYTVGETLVISCNITSTTAPVISWIHQGVTLTESNNIFINNNEMILTDGDVSVISTLTITELEITDDGLYNCQATNEHTAVEKNIASVTINGERLIISIYGGTIYLAIIVTLCFSFLYSSCYSYCKSKDFNSF